MLANVGVFMSVVALLAVVPGANNAVVTRQTLLGGRRSGLLTVAGTSTGIVAWAMLSALGVSAVLLTVPFGAAALHLGGAMVLAGLGVSTLWNILHPGRCGACAGASRTFTSVGTGGLGQQSR
jgi:threonine/homoserine/homoserine lactone efflux protein